MGWLSGCSYGLVSPGFGFLQLRDILLFSKTPKPTLGPNPASYTVRTVVLPRG
jgi:hypothetical protein